MKTIYSPKQLLTRVKVLPEFTEISSRTAWPRSYTSHRDHWVGWLKEQEGPGYYNRKRITTNARIVYNRIQNVGMIIWLGEAAGVEHQLVRAAILEAETTHGSVTRKTSVARSILSWDLVQKAIWD